MDHRIFIYHFKNDQSVRGRHMTYLCYEVQLFDVRFRVPLGMIRGVLHNQHHPDPQRRCHAELCFLIRMSSLRLYPGQWCQVTWFLSWSPCPRCASKVSDFLRSNRHVSLRIFAARLHTYHAGYEEGLRSLRDAGAQLSIMTAKEFEYCWRVFVDNHSWPFRPWNMLEKSSQAISERLQSILREKISFFHQPTCYQPSFGVFSPGRFPCPPQTASSWFPAPPRGPQHHPF
ncbi:DNA dC-_dU-editing enzyme APOBEC-3A-like [Echinops telfairi]|uniref:DNA dC->dU-editing enzyme APOBEC-3G n=1 Tax=Echinops telfairi TaxID=9371 RepID=A0ABM1VK08_ECHTE|nr:DNA dC->dU-editing enzyme APOBEC-3A-like [Echinops telfairi]